MHGGEQLIMSDGSSALTVRRPADFSIVRTLRVTMDGRPLEQLNELECAEGSVYANVWMQDLIVRIDPASGRVTERIEVAAAVVAAGAPGRRRAQRHRLRRGRSTVS